MFLGQIGTLSSTGWCSKCDKHHIPRNTGKKFCHLELCPLPEKNNSENEENNPENEENNPENSVKTRMLVVPIMLTGIAGTGVGSRIGGHARRGGGKLRENHRKHAVVAMTNEFRTSKTCVFCFEQVQLARANRDKKGTFKRVTVNGAVECVNPDCVSFKCGYTTRGGDSHAALAIAIAGASNLLSDSRTTIAPFSRTKPTNNAGNIPDTFSTIPIGLGTGSVPANL